MKKRGPRREPAALKDIVPGVMRGLSGRKRVDLEKVREVWSEIVGPATASSGYC